MGIKKYNPTTNGRRNMTTNDFAEITTDRPEKSLLALLRKKVGGKKKGKISVGNKGGEKRVKKVK